MNISKVKENHINRIKTLISDKKQQYPIDRFNKYNKKLTNRINWINAEIKDLELQRDALCKQMQNARLLVKICT